MYLNSDWSGVQVLIFILFLLKSINSISQFIIDCFCLLYNWIVLFECIFYILLYV